MAGTALLEVRGVGKRFAATLANDAVDLAVAAGEIHALLGENGAGKSTLVKIIYGVLRPDSGTMRFEGEPYRPASPSDARRRGIGMVFQHFSLFEALTVADNVALGIAPELATSDLAARIRALGDSYGLSLDPARLVGTLSAGERQRVEIVRCLLQDPKLVIMDEPTSVLTPQEAEALFDTLRRLAARGCAILYISHKLDEIRALCQRATILRHGRVVGIADPRVVSSGRLAELMMGHVLAPPVRPGQATGGVRLAVDGLTRAPDQAFGVTLADISFAVRGGEILGIAGIAGNGQGELMTALSGETPGNRPDAITLDGRAIGHMGPSQRRSAGAAFVPEQRLGHATVPSMSLADNVLLSAGEREHLMRFGFIRRAAASAFADRVVAAFDVRSSGSGALAQSLSGGNLQKFIVGRELLQNPSVLVVAQPTWGVDAGAAAAIRRALVERAAAGAAVLVISQDLDELFEIATRIAVMAAGRLSPARPASELTPAMVGRAMGGAINVAEPAHV